MCVRPFCFSRGRRVLWLTPLDTCEFLLSSSTFLRLGYTPDHCSCSALYSVSAHSAPLLKTVDEKPFAFLREGFSRFLRVEEFLSTHLG